MKSSIRLAMKQAEMRARLNAPEAVAPVVIPLARKSGGSLYHIYNCPCPVHPGSKPYPDGRCSMCAREYRKLNYDRNGNSAHDQYLSLRARAKRKGIAFDLSFGAFLDIVSQPCLYALNWRAGIRSGIDRKEAKLGYTVENSVPCCAKHNLFKSNILTSDQTKDAVRRYQVPCENTVAGRKKKARAR